MRSRTLEVPPEGLDSASLVALAREGGREPDFAIGFLPATPDLAERLAVLAAAWPRTLRLGCEASTQFADGRLTTSGALHAFWLDHGDDRDAPSRRPEVAILAGDGARPPGCDEIARFAAAIREAGGALLLVDGLRFPTEEVLGELERCLGPTPAPIAGGRASQQLPPEGLGARVFLGTEVLPSGCLALLLPGIDLRIEVVRGWSPASPIYTITRAAGAVVHEIDGAPATDWFRRFFTIDGDLAPLPEAADGFPLIIAGPSSRRAGLYRSLRTFDDPPGTVTLWGQVEAGDQVRIGMGSRDTLVPAARRLADSLEAPGPSGAPKAEAAILYSCVGREHVLGDRAQEEAASIREALGGIPLSGFFTLGEIGPGAGGRPAFYNHTAVLVLLREGTR